MILFRCVETFFNIPASINTLRYFAEAIVIFLSQMVIVFRKAMGIKIVDNNCGPGVVMKWIGYVCSLFVAVYFTYHYVILLVTAKYNLRSLQLDKSSPVVFVFFNESLDPLVVNNQFPTKDFQINLLQVDDYLYKLQASFLNLNVNYMQYGSLKFLKLFVKLRTFQPFFFVGDMMEFSFDLTKTGPNGLILLNYGQTCNLTLNQNAQNSAMPKIKFYDVDPNIYLSQKYFDVNGGFWEYQDCTPMVENEDANGHFTFELTFKPQSTNIARSDTMIIFISIFFVCFFGAILAIACYVSDWVLGLCFVLRRYDEVTLFNEQQKFD